MQELTSLDLSHNALLDATEVALSPLRKLRLLDVSFNTLQSVVLPGDCSHLVTFNLASNALTTLPSMSNMGSLRYCLQCLTHSALYVQYGQSQVLSTMPCTLYLLCPIWAVSGTVYNALHTLPSMSNMGSLRYCLQRLNHSALYVQYGQSQVLSTMPYTLYLLRQIWAVSGTVYNALHPLPSMSNMGSLRYCLQCLTHSTFYVQCGKS